MVAVGYVHVRWRKENVWNVLFIGSVAGFIKEHVDSSIDEC